MYADYDRLYSGKFTEQGHLNYEYYHVCLSPYNRNSILVKLIQNFHKFSSRISNSQSEYTKWPFSTWPKLLSNAKNVN